MQVVLNKQEKEKLVIRLHREGKTFREIAHIGHLSFTDIGKIIRKINGQKDEDIDLKNKSKDTQVYTYFQLVRRRLRLNLS
jgi:cytidylate kinase